MFDFSLGKLLLLAVIALLVLGPEKLPGAARTVGAMVRRLRSGWDSVRAEVERELEIEEIRRAARQAAADAEAAQSEASDTLRKMQSEMAEVRAQARALAAEQERQAGDVKTPPPAEPNAPAPSALGDDTDPSSDAGDGKH